MTSLVKDRQGRQRAVPDRYVLQDGESFVTSMMSFDAAPPAGNVTVPAEIVAALRAAPAGQPPMTADGGQSAYEARIANAWDSGRDEPAGNVPVTNDNGQVGSQEAYEARLKNAWKA